MFLLNKFAQSFQVDYRVLSSNFLEEKEMIWETQLWGMCYFLYCIFLQKFMEINQLCVCSADNTGEWGTAWLVWL